jgi:U3 small nucleolar RNA-associated protein 21
MVEKRVKFENSKPNYKGSRIFQPYRVIGHVITDIPFVLQMRGTELFVLVSVGRAFQIYNVAHLRLKFVSQSTTDTIRALCAVGNYVFAASGTNITKFERAKIIASLDSPSSASQMISLGDHLISIHEDNVVRVWDTASNELYTEITLPSLFTVSFMMHPNTYLNKILLGSVEGKLQLWNIKTK